MKRSFETRFNRDYLAGALLLVCGMAVAWQAHTYEVGSLAQMGPGFVPMCLGIALGLLGIAIAVGAVGEVAGANATDPSTDPSNPAVPREQIAPDTLTLSDREREAPPEWRGYACITLSIVLFIVLGRYGGLLPATFATVFVSALGDRQNHWRTAFVLAAVMTLVCLIVFHWGLQVQLSLFHWG